MTTARFPFVMLMAAVLLQGQSLVSQTNAMPQRTIADNNDKSPGDRPPDAQKDDREVRSEDFQTSSAGAEEHKHSGVTRTPAKIRPITSQSQRAHSRRLPSSKTVTEGSLRPDTAVSVVGPQTPGSKTGRVAPPNTPIRTRSTRVLPAVGISGHQFKNSREPGARLTPAGGPLMAAGGTAAINGSTMKRKP
jgi:hypothetical protein